MNTVTQLLQDLQRRGVTVRAIGDRIGFKPADAVPPDLLERMKRHKAELLQALRADAGRRAVGPLPVQPSEFTTLPSGRIVPNDLPADWRLLFEERAGIMEYDGNMPRERAEHLALQETIQAMKRGDTP